MTPAIRTRRLIVLVVCAVLGASAVARAQSAVDGFDPGANGSVRAFAVQPDGKILLVGEFTMLGGGGTGTTARSRIGRLNADGSVDGLFNPGANGLVYALALQPDGKILVAGAFTGLGGGTGATPRNYIGRLNADGSVDASFNPGANSPVQTLAVQPDGKILVGGYFTGLGGGTGTTPRNFIGRLNADGSVDTSFDPGTNNSVIALAVQPNGQILVGGSFSMLGGGGIGTTTRNRIGRLNADGSLDPIFNPGATNDTVLGVAVQPDGKILVSGTFTGLGGGTGTTARSRIGRLNADGSVDAGFDPGTNGSVSAMAVQPDGKILVGGGFTGLGGGTGTTTRNWIGRLYADGSLDTTLNPGANSSVLALAVQPDGKILVGGWFSALGGGGTGTTARNYIGRLNADGLVDASFNPGANSTVRTLAVQADGKILMGGSFTMLGSGTGTTPRNYIGRLNADGLVDPDFNPGADGTVYALAVQPDGKILVGGAFSILGNQEEYNLGRLNADGSVDGSFAVWTNGAVFTIALQPDGKILVGGAFTNLHDESQGIGLTRNRIGRINADGSLDVAFDPGANSDVYALAVQPDGKILVGGFFSGLGGGTGTTLRNKIGRLLGDGLVDLGFNPGANDEVRSLAVQADGKIVIGGAFTMLGGGDFGHTARNHIGAVAADGLLDPAFDPGASSYVFALAVQPDGKIVVGGLFTTLGGGGVGTTPRSYIGRLTNTGAAIQSLRAMGSGGVVKWLRSGTGPEVWRVTFESSSNGVTYTSLGSGTRVAGGWQLSGQSLPTNQNLYIRARGYYATGFANGSGSIVESVRNAYVVPYQPFTDNVLTASSSVVRAVHITELRARIDAQRTRYGLEVFSWRDPGLGVGTMVKAIHLADLRTALQEAYTKAVLPALVFTDSPIVPENTFIRAAHIQELRDAVIDLEGS